MDKTGIEWTDATWNPIRGCSRVSEGCRHCYAETMASRFSGPGLPYEGVAKDGRWTGKIRFVPEKLDQPLRWKHPRKIFVNSMSDLFHERVPDEWLDRIFAVMALAPHHSFQVLTKRPERMLDYFQGDPYDRILREADKIRMRRRVSWVGVSDPNISPMQWVWLGVSVEDQKTADERIPILLQTPAAVRWISAEPLLGEIDLSCIRRIDGLAHSLEGYTTSGEYRGNHNKLDWVVAGGESGPGSRPMHPDWVRGIRDQCVQAGTPFLFKQFGDWHFCSDNELKEKMIFMENPKPTRPMYRVGKKTAGRVLDGKTWDEYPKEVVKEISHG